MTSRAQGKVQCRWNTYSGPDADLDHGLSADAHRPPRHGARHQHWLEFAPLARARASRTGARLIISARRMTLTFSTAAAGFWAILWPEIMALEWAADP